MYQTEPSHVWWDWIAGPKRILDSIVSLLNDQKTVIIKSSNIPWVGYMREHIRSKIIGIYTSDINCAEIETSELELGDFLLEKFGSAQNKADYRPGFGDKITDYLREKSILKGKLIWFHDAQEGQLNKWAEFFKKYKQKNIDDGIFILEYTGNTIYFQTPRIINIDVMEGITIYDILSFSMIIVSDFSVPEIWKHYLAWISSLTFEKNIENLADFLNFDFHNKDISDVLKALISDNNIDIDDSKIKESVWQAQLQIFFPVIEKLRNQLIDRYYNAITGVLIERKVEYQGNPINSPYDMELATMVLLANQRRPDNRAWLYLPDKTFADIVLLHTCRNKIAHREICEKQELDQIIVLSSAL